VSVIGGLIGHRARVGTASPLDQPTGELLGFLGGAPASSGVAVTEEAVLQHQGILCALRRRANVTGMLPLDVFRRRADGGRERAMDYPLYDLLHWEPNGEMTSLEFRETMQGNLDVRGNAYAEIEWDKATGYPRALWWLRSDWVSMRRDTSGQLYYVFSYDKNYMLLPHQVLHIRGFALNGLLGPALKDSARESLGTSIALDRFAGKFFADGAAPSGTLEHPGKLTKPAQERLRKQFEEAYAGLSRAHRLMVLEEGMKWAQRGISPEDAQALESRTYQVNEAARALDMPPHMLGELSHATYTNIEHQAIEFGVFTAGPIVRRWEQRIQMSLIPREERSTYYAEFNLDGLLRGDTQTRSQVYARMWGIGALCDDEIREKENMNPLPNGVGKHHFVPVNMMTVEKALAGGGTVTAPGDGGSGGNGHKDLLGETMELLLRNDKG